MILCKYVNNLLAIVIIFILNVVLLEKSPTPQECASAQETQEEERLDLDGQRPFDRGDGGRTCLWIYGGADVRRRYCARVFHERLDRLHVHAGREQTRDARMTQVVGSTPHTAHQTQRQVRRMVLWPASSLLSSMLSSTPVPASCGRPVSYRGIVIVNRVPTPSRERTSMVPPWLSTIHLAIERPRPEPPEPDSRALSAR